MMKRAWKSVTFLLSCAAFSVAGWRLAFSAHPAVAGTSVRETSADGRSGKVEMPATGKGGASSASALQTKAEVQQKLMAKAKTEDLWEWMQQPEVQGGSDWELEDAILEELVQRLGWIAWDRALALEEPEVRKEIAGAVLDKLAGRDPWKAYELWKVHHEEISLPSGMSVIMQVVNSAAGVSAPLVIEVLEETGEEGRAWTTTKHSFAAGFDFPAVLEFLDNRHSFLLTPEDLLKGWAQESPVAASQWLADHPNPVVTGQLLGQIATMSLDAPGRAEALEIFGRMPAEERGQWWYESGFKAGVLSPGVLEATTRLNQRQEYLGAVLERTLYGDALDPSWQQIPVQEREAVAEKVESTMPPVAELSPLQQRQRERWRRIVSAGPK